MPFNTVPGPDGHNYDIYIQDKSCSCTAACILTVAKLLNLESYDETDVREMLRKESAAKTVGKGLDFNEVRTGMKNWDICGMDPDTVARVLSTYFHLTGAYTYKKEQALRSHLASSSRTNPSILGMSGFRLNTTTQVVTALGGHVVVSAGIHNGEHIFLDTRGGILVTNPIGDFPYYYPTYGQAGATRTRGRMEILTVTR
ncbi:MAG: hypothetical protein ACYSU3_13425 [Planctomycetota bacterium]